jgi:dipeptidyl aminopeptidase/acylaminoacyl peptidase
MGIPPFPCAELLVFWGGQQFGFDGFAHNPVEYASSVSCPALVMHGENDPRARLSEAHSVFAAMRGPKEFKEFPATGHESYLVRFPSEWRTTVDQFLAEVK